MSRTARGPNPEPAGGSRADLALALHGLTVEYGPVRALRDVSIEVPDGGIVAVLGGNGAGKSTLLRAVSGVLPFHGGSVRSGDIIAGGRRLRGLRPDQIVGHGVVQVPEGRHVFSRMTVAENLRAGALGSRDRGLTGGAHRQVLELFPVLGERAGQRAGLLSGGEQQMLAIGRALMAAPRLLLLDEPSLGLAPRMAVRIAETITAINERGTSVLLIEQNAALALRLASYAYVIEVGEVALEGTARELSSSDDVRRRYLGPATEELPADELRRASGPALTRWAG